MTDLVIQGIATQFDTPFIHGDNIKILKSGVFDSSMRSRTDIKFLLDHEESKSFGSWDFLGTGAERLQIHAGKKSLIFRYLIPMPDNHVIQRDDQGNVVQDSSSRKLLEVADDYDTYVPVSIGFNYKASNTEVKIVNGIKVETVVEANLYEISLLSTPPAVCKTYARVSLEKCGTLQEDYESGLFEAVGSYVSLHRAFTASENGGGIKYSHATSGYDSLSISSSASMRRSKS